LASREERENQEDLEARQTSIVSPCRLALPNRGPGHFSLSKAGFHRRAGTLHG
jgi:hypothetical protein